MKYCSSKNISFVDVFSDLLGTAVMWTNSSSHIRDHCIGWRVLKYMYQSEAVDNKCCG